MTYKASLDKMAISITTIIVLLFATIIIGQFSFLRTENESAPYFINTFILLIFGISYAFRPISYSLNSSQLIIHRPIKDVKIDLSKIKTIELLEDEKLSWSIRTFGVGGLFGYYGKYANSKLGSMTWYATRRKKTVLVETIDNKKIILTPDRAGEFVESFKLL